MQDDEIGSRTSAWAVGVSGTSPWSCTNVAGLAKCPVKPFTVPPPTSWRQETYGVLPANVMSGRLASPVPVEIGAPPLASSKCALAPEPTRCETNTCSTPFTSSSHVTHGEVGLAGFIVPAATRGFSALPVGVMFSEHCPSFAADSAHLPSLFTPLVSSVPLSWLPTTTHWK